MTLRVAVQMDPIASINPKTDSTLLLMQGAVRRGHEIFYYTPEHLTYREGSIVARGHKLIFAADGGLPALGDAWYESLHDMDVVLLRQDPPFNMTYLSTTYLLEQLMPEVLVVNNPTSVRNFPEKIFPTLLEHYMPPTMISADIQAIEEFRDEHEDIVIKPLYGYGGKGILRLKEDDQNFHALMEMFFQNHKEPIMVQKFLPEVTTGDRRIIMIGGEVAGVMGRIPASDDIRANMRVGGTPIAAILTAKQAQMCDELGEMLRAEGIVFAGVDVIGNDLTEINITSPTGMVAMNTLYGSTLEDVFWDEVEASVG